MKKRTILMLMFIMMFFVGSNEVFAKNKKGDKGYEDYNAAYNTIMKNLNKNLDNAKIACLYEVEFDGEIYYNYIYYHDGNDKIIANSTFEGNAVAGEVSTTKSPFLVGSAYDGLIKNYSCPKNSYIDMKFDNEICFDNGDINDCLNNNERYNFGTVFGGSSTLVMDYADSLKVKSLILNNACSKTYLPSEYSSSNTKVCRYIAPNTSNGMDYIILLYNSSSSMLIHDDYAGKRITLPYGSTISKSECSNYISGGSNGGCTSTITKNYRSTLGSNLNSCPEKIYLNSKYKGSNNEYDYPFSSINMDGYETVMTFDYMPCDVLSNYDENTFSDCDSLIPLVLQDLIDDLMSLIKIIVPILLIVLVSYDLVAGMFLSDNKDSKKIRDRIIKRVIIAVIIFFVPTLINLVFDLVNEVWDNANLELCGISEETE